MLSEKTRTLVKEIFLIAGVFAALSGAYLGLAYAQRYILLTDAYLAQSEQLILILNEQAERARGK